MTVFINFHVEKRREIYEELKSNYNLKELSFISSHEILKLNMINVKYLHDYLVPKT